MQCSPVTSIDTKEVRKSVYVCAYVKESQHANQNEATVERLNIQLLAGDEDDTIELAVPINERDLVQKDCSGDRSSTPYVADQTRTLNRFELHSVFSRCTSAPQTVTNVL